MRPIIVASVIVMFVMPCIASPARAEDRGGARRESHVARDGGHRPAAAPRTAVASRAGVVPRAVVAPRVVGRPRIVGVAPVRFFRPYYAFRPRVSLGFGLIAGYPVAYPYYYPYAYPYPYAAYPPAPYGYPSYPYPAQSPSSGYPAPGYPPNSVGVQPGTANSAGLSFEITPNDAEVYVDGSDVGPVSSFGPASEPLSVTPGRHHVEIRRQGYQTIALDVDALAGQVIPYQGSMQPY
jgi:PEGA domain